MGPEPTKRLKELLTHPREDPHGFRPLAMDLDAEYKNWLFLSSESTSTETDRANLAKAMIALANHGGGFLVVGFRDAGTGWTPDPGRPGSLAMYTQDKINGIVARYAEPSFHCQVDHVIHPDSDVAFPVISVPGNHLVPIRSKRDDPERRHIQINKYYVRRPGPSSDEPQSLGGHPKPANEGHLKTGQ